jgi:hypothetical protein
MRVGRVLIAVLLVFSSLNCLANHQVEGKQKSPTESANQPIPSKQPKAQNKQTDESKTQQKPSNNADGQPGRPLEIVLFINDVRSAQPEFAADLLIRIAGSDKISDTAWKAELIEEAFRLASSTQQPVKRAPLPSSPTDTRTGFLASAFALGLDGLSLQCRAANAMLSIDKHKARELFGDIPKPKLQPVNCEDGLVYDLSDFYGTLKKLAETAFSSEEIKLDEPVRLIESNIGQMVSPVELAPVMELIGSFKTSSSKQESLVYVFARALSGISGDDRSFTQSLYYVDRGMKNLITQCLQRGLSTGELLRAYRTYLVRHFSAVRCADSGQTLSQRAQAAVISEFNSSLRLKTEKNIAEISADDVKPSAIQGTVGTHTHWQSPKAAALLTKIKELRFGSANTPLTAAERDALDWRAKLDDFMKDLADWRKEDEKTEEDYFHQKCVLLRGLIEMIPQKTTREEVIRSLMEFLNSYDLQRASRIEWFWQARFLLKDIVNVEGPGGSSAANVMAHTEVLPILEASKNPILYLYTQAEKLFQIKRP